MLLGLINILLHAYLIILHIKEYKFLQKSQKKMIFLLFESFNNFYKSEQYLIEPKTWSKLNIMEDALIRASFFSKFKVVLFYIFWDGFSKVHIFGVHTFSKKLETRFSALKFFGCNLFKLSVALKCTRHIMMILKPKFQHYASTFQF